MSDPILEARNLKQHFPIRAGILRREVGHVRAVDGIDIAVAARETIGIVGESGCGKSTLGRLLVRLLEPTGGSLFFEGRDTRKFKRSDHLKFCRNVQIIFQNPYASLDSRLTVGRIIGQPLQVHRIPGDHRMQVERLLEMVGLNPQDYGRYPHEFSGGQRQRIAIARAIALSPQIIVCDEATSALDVSIQAQIINLLKELQREVGMALVFISHDLAVVERISDRVMVMYLGRAVELSDAKSVYRHPAHPYTHALLSAIPVPDPKVEKERRRVVLRGQVPSAAAPPEGCNFSTRCPRATDRCRREDPSLEPISQTHLAACFYPLSAGESLEAEAADGDRIPLRQT